MKENAPKKIRFQTLRTLWVPLAIGVVTVAALAVVVGMVWKDYRTAMMDSQTRQMELVVQSTADSIRVLLEEYADRLDSIAEKAEASKAFRPTVARSDTIRDVWLENSNGEVIYSCYGLSAVCDVLITRTEDISYWQYHSGDEHYLVMKKKAGGETACLVVDSTVMYQQLISEIHVGRNGYIMIKNNDNLVVMHPEAVQWDIKVVEGGKIALSIKRTQPAPERGHRPQGGGNGGPRPNQPRQKREEKPRVWQPKPQAPQGEMSFEDMMARYKSRSEEKIADLKRVTENHRGGYSRRRG